ncbi:hypothetical protein [Nocardioides nanhaiensis]|uniref:Uncharacterized protein n=1 Tax=Nocardioides nanhaiensis TaxID=1476871 RepID=A0ABP8W6D5_9ACTN
MTRNRQSNPNVPDAITAPDPTPDPALVADADTADPTATGTLHADGEAVDIPAGTPVVADGGRVGKVLSSDPITGQVQIGFEGAGRGWFAAHVVTRYEAGE